MRKEALPLLVFSLSLLCWITATAERAGGS